VSRFVHGRAGHFIALSLRGSPAVPSRGYCPNSEGSVLSTRVRAVDSDGKNLHAIFAQTVMPQYLLTGAGFSRNWGAWLADEAFEYLLGCSDLTPHQRNLLWKHKTQRTGFEGALQELIDLYLLHRDDRSAQELQSFSALLLGMFDSMNIGFATFEPGRHEHMGPQPTSIRDFLCRFDALFTLNQDTLLETHYLPTDIREGSQGRWVGCQSPGLIEENPTGVRSAPPHIFRPSDSPFALNDRMQRYYKLHGSSNWRALNGATILILGANKRSAIDGIALLDWYRNQFRAALAQPGARLMIVGYSFRDAHINEIIEQAKAQIFIIDPLGVDVLDGAPALPGPQLKQRLEGKIIGASRRRFLDNFTSDPVELRKIMRFFSTLPCGPRITRAFLPSISL
jgi:hypothetical protein